MSRFYEKYQKNTNSTVSNPKISKQKHVQGVLFFLFYFSFTNPGACFHFSLNSYQLNINEHEFMQRKWYLKYHMFVNLISSTKHEEQLERLKKPTLILKDTEKFDEIWLKFKWRRWREWEGVNRLKKRWKRR